MAEGPIDTAGAAGPEPKWTRRRVLTVGVGGIAAIAAVGVAGIELVARGDLPGQQTLDQIDGECSIAKTPLVFSSLGPSTTGTFYSRARNQTVGYTIAYPPD